MLLQFVFGGTAAVFLAMSAAALFHSQWARRLPSLAFLNRQSMPERDLGICSIVVAARDEEARIEDTVRRLVSQGGVQVEVIIVDDRSTDGTSDILRRLATEDERLQVLRIDCLPDGWLGKCQACHTGANAAKGDWILFTDADCWLQPDVIERALLMAEREQADHIALTPGIVGATLGAQAWHLVFLISLLNWFAGVNRDRPKAYLGMGAFNLVRKSAYQQCGGYEALRMTVLDDVRLGLLLCRAGKRTRAFIGGDDVQCHWGTTVKDMFKVMEKNYFAAIDFRLRLVLAAGLLPPTAWFLGIIGPFTGTLAGLAAGLALLSLSIPAYILARRLNWSLAPAILAPFMFPALFFAMINSAWVTVRQGGIRWRDTFYPLDQLREGAVR